MRKLFVASAALALLVISCAVDQASSWKIADNPLITEWALHIDPSKPWNTYPRPGMARRDWLNMNGLWNYAITPVQTEPPLEWEGKILVPYPVESALSGVKRSVSHEQMIWYRTTVKVPSKWKGKKLLLNFEASDWETRVWVNGNIAGSHRGGYDPFTFDISDYAEPGKPAEITVSVWDPTDHGPQPRGKQVSKPGGIWYTPSSGIWQTVWMEPVSASYIESFRTYTSVDDSTITVVPAIHNAGDGFVRLTVSARGKTLGSARSDEDPELKVTVENPIFWRPDNPFLYDIKLELVAGDKVVDAVTSTAGIRSVKIGKSGDGFTRILLNNEFVFQNGPLDQGFWPDGLYTPPSEEAMIYDLWMTKEMGFNMLRKHVKIENRVFYNWCDRIGLLVWQDMPSGDRYISGNMPDIVREPESDKQFRLELSRMIETRFNHPSIIVWVPFNEGWGQYDTDGITRFINAIDPTRLVNSASGWTDRGTGDMLDIHNYPDPRSPASEEQRAIVLGEFGGLGLPVENHTWEKRNWGYRNMTSTDELLSKYEEYYVTIREMVKNRGLSAVVYTQTTDVETETNGLMTYDRKIVKMGADNIFKAHAGQIPPRLINRSSIFIDTFMLQLGAVDSTAIIRFTTDGSEPLSSSQLYDGPVKLSGSSEVSAKAWYGTGSSRIVSFEIEKVAPIEATQPSGVPEKGLQVNIYEGNYNTIPVFDSLTPVRNIVSDRISHVIAGTDSRFCLLFEGLIKVEETGVFGFHLTSDDGSRLIIDDQLVSDNDGIHGMTEKSGYIALESGFHRFRLEFFQRTGGVGLRLEIEYPDGERKEITQGSLFRMSGL